MYQNHRPLRTNHHVVSEFIRLYTSQLQGNVDQDLIANRLGNVPEWAVKDPCSYWLKLSSEKSANEIFSLNIALPVEIVPWRRKAVADWLVNSCLDTRPFQYILLADRNTSSGLHCCFGHFLIGPREKSPSKLRFH
jgi:hypothetical protein